MAAKIGVKIALDGEREFKQALKACKDEVKLYKDSLKTLDDTIKSGKGTLQDYTAKQEALRSKQKALTDQLDAAKRGLQNANEQYDKQKTKLNDLEKEYKEAKEEAERLRKETGENSEAFKKQQERVDALKDAVDRQTSVVNTAKTRTNTWTGEIRNAESALRTCDAELRENEQAMLKAGNAADDASDDYRDFAEDAGKAASESSKLSVSLGDMIKNKVVDLAGDALQALGKKAIDAAKYVVQVGSSFEAQMSKVQAIANTSAAEAEQLAAKASEMGRTTMFTASQAGEALEYMAMAGWKTKDMVAGLDGIMALAAASGEDLGTTSDIVTDALTAFGREAGESGRLADIMAAASSNANTNVAMMGETFKYAAPVAGALGYSMEDTSLAIGLMANAGIKASQAGTSLRAGLTNLVKPSKQASDAMEKYGISVTDTDGKMLTFHDLMLHLKDRLGGLSESEQAAAVAAIFGKNAMSGWLAVINSSDSDFDNLTSAIYNSEGAASRMADTMNDNLQGKIALFNSAVEGLGIALYNYFSGPLQSVVEIATGFINGITDLLTPQKTELESFIDSVKKSNEEVEKSIQHAQQTVTTAENKVAEMEVYKQEFSDILDKCGQFNKIDLGDGYYRIVDTTGRTIEEGFKPLGESATTTEDIIKMFGKDGIKTGTIKAGTTLVAQYFDKDGAKIGETRGALDEFGNATINTANVETGTNVVITCFNDAGEKVAGLETTVDGAELKFHTDGITSSVGTITENIGYITTAVEGVEQRLKTFAEHGIDTASVEGEETAVIEYFDDVGQKIDEVAVKIGDFGNIEIPVEGLGIENGTKAIITCFDATTGSVQSFETEVEKLQSGQIDLNTITTEFGRVEDSVRQTYVITDAFTKSKINAMIETMGTSVEGLAEAWNSQTGELTASKEELEKWFDTAKEVAMYQALESAIQELYTAWGQAAANAVEAESALSEAKEKLNDLVEQRNALSANEIDQYKLLSDAIDLQTGKVKDAETELEKANRLEQESAGHLETTAARLQEKKDKLGDVINAEKDNQQTLEQSVEGLDAEGEAAEGASDGLDGLAESTEELTDKQEEAIAGFQEMFNVTDEGLSELQQELGLSNTAFADWCQKRTEETQKIIDAYDDLVEKLADSMRGYVTALNTSGEEGTRAIDNMINTLTERNQKLEKWVENMKKLGERAGKDMPQALYDQILAEGPEKTMEAVQALVDAAESQTGEFERVATEYERGLEITESAETLASYSSTGKAYAEAVKNGYKGTQEEFEKTVKDSNIDAANAAKNSTGEFEEAGKQAGQKEKAGLEGQSAAVSQASGAVVDAAHQAAEVATQKFERVGQVAMTYLTRGMSERADFPANKLNDVMEAAKNAAIAKTADFERAGQAIMTYLARGMSERSDFPSSKIAEVLSAAKQTGDSYANQFSYVGQAMADNLRFGIVRGSMEVWRASDNMGAAARNAQTYHINTFIGAGESMAYGLAQGIWNKQSVAIEAAWNLAWNSLVAAKNALGIRSPSKEFAKVGEFSDEGMASGFEKNRALVENAARQSARAAKEAAEDELTGSDYYTDLTSKINYAGAEQMNRISNMRVETADTASAMRQLSQGISTLQSFAESLQNPQAPNISVMIGNKEFKGYIVRTASEGLSGQMRDIRTGVGA